MCKISTKRRIGPVIEPQCFFHPKVRVAFLWAGLCLLTDRQLCSDGSESKCAISPWPVSWVKLLILDLDLQGVHCRLGSVCVCRHAPSIIACIHMLTCCYSCGVIYVLASWSGHVVTSITSRFHLILHLVLTCSKAMSIHATCHACHPSWSHSLDLTKTKQFLLLNEFIFYSFLKYCWLKVKEMLQMLSGKNFWIYSSEILLAEFSVDLSGNILSAEHTTCLTDLGFWPVAEDAWWRSCLIL